jgi:hypothetical protein
MAGPIQNKAGRNAAARRAERVLNWCAFACMLTPVVVLLISGGSLRSIEPLLDPSYF